MATSGGHNSPGGLGGSYARVEWSRTGVGANSSNIYAELIVQLQGGTSLAASESGAIRINGGESTFSRGTTSRSTNSRFVAHTWSGTINHDANGNGSFNIGGRFTSSFSSFGTLTVPDTWYTLDRIPLAPTNTAPVASNVKQRTATITAGSSSNGHGTSVDYDIRYRKQGDTTWVTRGFASSTWNVTGLKPGTVYEIASRARNNNGDIAAWTTGLYTFKTQPVSGMLPVLMGLLNGG